MEDIDDYIQLLANNNNIMINQLKGDLKHAYLEIKKWVSELYNTPNYFLITDAINKQYRPSQLNPGSIGAFLWGCSNQYYGDVPKSCSALCINSIPFNETKECQYQIWRHTGKLIKENFVKNSIAYLYVDDNWKGITNDEYKIMKSNNVNYVTIINTNSSKHYIKSKIKPLEDIPILKINDEIIKQQSNNYTIVVLVFLIIIIIFFQKYEIF